jgi:TPR repeat protein
MTTPAFADAVAVAVATRSYGDYATALRIFHALADQGDATAQYNLGVM